MEYFPDVARLIVEYLKNAPIDILKNMKKEQLTDIMDNLAKMLKRFRSIGQKNKVK